MKPLEFGPGVWTGLIADLRRRGQGRRESGAFLLGCETEVVKFVETWLPYDELDPASLNYDYIRLETSAFPKLWAHCEARGVQVVADVHTHPGMPEQSESDQAYPMVSISGHVALIVPWFARAGVTPADLSFNVYLGGGEWDSKFRQEAADLIKLGEDDQHGR